jgi:hypothetical protein
VPAFELVSTLRPAGDQPAAIEALVEGLRAEKRALDRFVGSFAGRGRLIVPRHEDWVLVGVLLARRRRLAGDLVARDHLADVLLVLSASQVNGTVLTANVRHLMVWASLARRAGRDVRAGSPELLPV